MNPLEHAAAAGEPSDPIAAATHPDPYPYYARLIRECPLYRDERLGLWVASSASAVIEVLTNEHCQVRPITQRVPSTLEGSPAGELFGRLVRMNDGENHCPLKQAILATLDAVDRAALLAAVRHCAIAWTSTFTSRSDRAGLTRFMFSLPVQTIAMLLGVPDVHLADTIEWIETLVAGIAPIASAAEVERGKAAATQLQDLCRDLLSTRGRQSDDALLSILARQALLAGRGADDLIIANGIGLMSQTYEATAGLIGNTLLALAKHADVLTAVCRSPELLANVIEHVLCADPPVQSTRRFVVRTARIAGASMTAGDAILVMLAAAGRDAAINPEPERFDLGRGSLRTLTFGAGIHSCPARQLAPVIAQEAVAHLLVAGFRVQGLERHVSYRRSNHVRMPVF
jgi:cytochrome P450